MFTKEMIDKARAIVSQLDIPEQFGCDEDGGEFDDSALYNQVSAVYSGEFSIETGISKCVIVLPGESFVIKIPFNGTHYYDYEYNEETDEYEEVEHYFNKFTVVEDYCEREMELTEVAQERGFSQFVLNMICFYIDKRGRAFYMQERARTDRCSYGISPTSVSQRSRDVAESMRTSYCYGNESWRAAIVECYGEDTWYTFVNWNVAGNIGILSDMHGGNYGYRLDGTPVLIDISGFKEN